jgi:DNA-directed RNA polymerase specialized sigma24 family protein
MDSEGSVSRYIGQLKAGDRAAAGPVCERYFARLTQLAEQRLRGTVFAAFDGEDVALSAFDSFFRAVADGRFAQLTDRNELWALLAEIASRKLVEHVRQEHAQKRNVDRVESGGTGLNCRPDWRPDPKSAALMADECRRLLDLLGEEVLCEVALLKVEGFTDKEVAAKLGCGVRTVERKLERIRRIWRKEIVE